MKAPQANPIAVAAISLCLALATNLHGSCDGARLASLKADAAQGDAQAQCELGRRYEHGIDLPQNYRKAIHWYRQAAEQHVPKAQYRLGSLFAARQKHQKALLWFRRAAAQNHALAQNRLGLIYERGQGVPQDSAEAFKWFTLAADNGEIYAVGNLRALTERITVEELAEGHRRVENLKAALAALVPTRSNTAPTLYLNPP